METFAIIAIASLIWVFINAWENEKIIRQEKRRRKFVAAINMVLVWGLVAYFALGFTWIAFTAFLIPFVLRLVFFDPILNKLMDWPNQFTGSTSFIDKLITRFKIPFWFRYIVLIIFIGILILILR